MTLFFLFSLIFFSAVCPNATIWNGSNCATPIIEEPEKEMLDTSQLTKHGIWRNSIYFEMYLKWQEIIAMRIFNSSDIQNDMPTFKSTLGNYTERYLITFD